MKVLMFGWEFPPFSSGGLGTHCHGLVKSLHSGGVETVFVMPNTGKNIRSDFVKIIQAGRGKFIKIASFLTPYLTSPEGGYKPVSGARKKNVYGLEFFNEVKRYTELAVRSVRDEECDVIHCHDWMTFPAGIRVKEEKGKPLVVTVHSTEFDRCPLAPNQEITHIEWEGMYRADRIITVSEYEKKNISQRYNVPGEKIEVVYNAVDPGCYGKRPVRFGLDEKVVLFLGRVTMQKGPDYFLHAAKKVLESDKEVRFVVVGEGDMLHELVRKSVHLGISDSVFFTGFADSISDYYSMADLYVMPSVSEPFGITALEAASSGTPVIISKTSGVAEVFRHCMKVDFWDSDSLANKIIGVLRHDCMRREMEKNGHREATGFSWDNVAQRTIGIYSRITS
jgi:glycogen(starch) synthase